MGYNGKKKGGIDFGREPVVVHHLQASDLVSSCATQLFHNSEYLKVIVDMALIYINDY